MVCFNIEGENLNELYCIRFIQDSFSNISVVKHVAPTALQLFAKFFLPTFSSYGA